MPSLFSDNAFAIFNFVSSPPDRLLPSTLWTFNLPNIDLSSMLVISICSNCGIYDIFP